MTTTTIRIEYGTDHVIMTWDGAQASAPIRVDGETTPYQTASARHRTDLAVALACRVAWPEATWPEVPATGSVGELEATEAWDEMSYVRVYAREEQLDALRRQAVNDVTREIMHEGVLLTHEEADDLGEEVLDWMEYRLGLNVTETDAGVECRPAVRS